MWPFDIEYKGDEIWTFEHVQSICREDRCRELAWGPASSRRIRELGALLGRAGAKPTAGETGPGAAPRT